MDAEQLFRYAKPEAPTINVVLNSKIDIYDQENEDAMKENGVRFYSPLHDSNHGLDPSDGYSQRFIPFEQSYDIGITGRGTPFSTGVIDVIDLNTGRILNRNQAMVVPDYTVDGTVINVAVPGNYGTRVTWYAHQLEENLIEVNSGLIQSISDPEMFDVGVPFWPQVMSWPEFGFARVSADGMNLVFCSHRHQTGQTSFMYRLVNGYGQSSELACVNVTCV